MRSLFAFVLLFSVSAKILACGSDAQHREMATRLYSGVDMPKFVCGADACTFAEFESGLQFSVYDESYKGKVISVCLVAPKLSSTNSYTGVFVSKGSDLIFQMISFGTGIKVGASKNGVPMISEGSVDDPDNPDYSVNQYLWNGGGFIFSRTVKPRP